MPTVSTSTLSALAKAFKGHGSEDAIAQALDSTGSEDVLVALKSIWDTLGEVEWTDVEKLTDVFGTFAKCRDFLAWELIRLNADPEQTRLKGDPFDAWTAFDQSMEGSTGTDGVDYEDWRSCKIINANDVIPASDGELTFIIDNLLDEGADEIISDLCEDLGGLFGHGLRRYKTWLQHLDAFHNFLGHSLFGEGKFDEDILFSAEGNNTFLNLYGSQFRHALLADALDLVSAQRLSDAVKNNPQTAATVAECFSVFLYSESDEIAEEAKDQLGDYPSVEDLWFIAVRNADADAATRIARVADLSCSYIRNVERLLNFSIKSIDLYQQFVPLSRDGVQYLADSSFVEEAKEEMKRRLDGGGRFGKREREGEKEGEGAGGREAKRAKPLSS
jgi:hypothetical protein